jgi:hypothetical protein
MPCGKLIQERKVKNKTDFFISKVFRNDEQEFKKSQIFFSHPYEKEHTEQSKK